MRVRMTANRLEEENEKRGTIKMRAKAEENRYPISGKSTIILDKLSDFPN